MKFGYVYKSTNLINRRIYIGQHTGRFDKNYFGSGTIIKRALKKYGVNNFQLEILSFANNKENLNILEKKYINEYRKLLGRNILYNITDGGESGTRFGPHTEETKAKIRASLPDMSGSGNSFFGRKHSEKTKEKLRQINLGKKRPEFMGENNPSCRPEVREKNRLSHIGKKPSLESRRKMSISAKGKKRPRTEEHQKNLSFALKGRKTWCKGLTKKTDERLANAGKKIFIALANRKRHNGRFI